LTSSAESSAEPNRTGAAHVFGRALGAAFAVGREISAQLFSTKNRGL